MAFIILPNKARKQPTRATPLNQKHWLAKDVTFAFSGVMPNYDAANDKRIAGLSRGGSGWSWRATKKGFALYTPDGGWADLSINQDWSGPNTIIALCRLNSIDTPYGGLFAKNSSGVSTQFAVGRDNATSSLYGAVEDGTAVGFGGASISSLTDFSVLAFTHSGVASTAMSYYRNGAPVGSTTALGTQNTGTGALGLGRERSSSASFDSDVDWIGFIRVKRVLNSREIRENYRRFWELWEPENTRVLFFSTSAITGTVSYTNANDTLAASGTTTVTGSLAKTNTNDTLAASGTTTVKGTLAKTNANDTSAASGTTTVTGTLARTNASDTLSASGTTTVTGSLAKTNANDTVSASGSVGSAVSGTLAYTNANDTSAASGATTVTGSLAKTNANDTSAASGTTTIVGTLAKTNANDTVSASGTVTTGSTGTVAYTNKNDTLSASGTTKILGSLARTNANDSLAASGAVNNGIIVESALIDGITATIRIKKPGIPAGTPDWLKTTLEIVLGRRGNRVTPPPAQTLTFSSTPTKAECEALYAHVNNVHSALTDLINRFDT